MVAYLFQQRFVEPILAGTKRQTIRANRNRHARPGEEMQLYTGMRTKYCHLVARVTCASAQTVKLVFSAATIGPHVVIESGKPVIGWELEAFARRDGFDSWFALREFWREHDPGVDEFQGVLITWEPLSFEPSLSFGNDAGGAARQPTGGLLGAASHSEIGAGFLGSPHVNRFGEAAGPVPAHQQGLAADPY